jgi:hypothetical protein
MDSATKDLLQKVIRELEQLNRTLNSFLKLFNRSGQINHQPAEDTDRTQDESGASEGVDLSALHVGPTSKHPPKTGGKWHRPFAWWKTRTEFAAYFFAIAYAIITFFQWKDARLTFQLDQRPWVGVVFPDTFALDGSSIPVVVKIQNTGKTPARAIEGDLVATVWTRGEDTKLGDFSSGRPHNRVYSGAIFPSDSVQMTISVSNYGAEGQQTIVPDESLRHDIANGKRYIMYFGRITYSDTFNVRHWTQFCTGSTPPPSVKDMKDCTSYNDVDHNE